MNKILGVLTVLSAFASQALAVDDRVPEVDPGFLGASVALLIGGALLFGHKKK